MSLEPFEPLEELREQFLAYRMHLERQELTCIVTIQSDDGDAVIYVTDVPAATYNRYFRREHGFEMDIERALEILPTLRSAEKQTFLHDLIVLCAKGFANTALRSRTINKPYIELYGLYGQIMKRSWSPASVEDAFAFYVLDRNREEH